MIRTIQIRKIKERRRRDRRQSNRSKNKKCFSKMVYKWMSPKRLICIQCLFHLKNFNKILKAMQVKSKNKPLETLSKSTYLMRTFTNLKSYKINSKVLSIMT